jgi:hypothetical protein
LAATLQNHVTALADAFTGLAAPQDRLEYGWLWLHRLLLITELQRTGYLAGGDRWYLHTQLSHHQQIAPDTFFREFLTPLCHLGLALPPSERPPHYQSQMVGLPFLGGTWFRPHPLELTHSEVDISDAPLEKILAWVAEQPWERLSHPEMQEPLAETLEWLVTQAEGQGHITSQETLQAICDRTVDAYLLQTLAPYTTISHRSLDDHLAHLTPSGCAALVETILPSLTVLDPACGSGRFLLMALSRLQKVYQRCWEYAQTCELPLLQDWKREIAAVPQPLAWTFTYTILTQNLYGVDLCPNAVTLTHLQLTLALLGTTTQRPQDLAPLPDLTLNITAGNALLGLIRVDEASFDTILPKPRRSGVTSDPVMQGNLLQPLVAASYRDTLAEKQIRVEHYRAQTQAMGEAIGVPEYAQAEFLRDRLDEVMHTTQVKLHRLLLNTCSQKLGLQIRTPNLSGGTQTRQLTLPDIATLHPLHWGFVFSEQLAAGGFHVIVTHPPPGSLRPNRQHFFQAHATAFAAAQIHWENFRRSPRRSLRQAPELESQWLEEQGRVALLRAYCRRSDDYARDRLALASRTLSYHILFSQRCLALSHPQGIPPYLYNP